MKKYILVLASMVFWLSFTLAQQVDHYIVEIDPNPTTVNVANDVIIKAVDIDGNVVEDYVWEALFIIYDEEWNEITDQFDTLPWDGIVEFNVEDQWIKRYSKSLIFSDPWVYKIEVMDAADDTIKWETDVSVNEEWQNTTDNIQIEIVSPVDGSTETSLPVDVLANTNSPNTIYKIFLDGNEYSSGLTDENGQIQDSLDNIKEGNHQLEIKLYDVDNNVIWQSNIVSFSYKAWDIDYFEKIEILPSNQVYQDEKADILVYTKEKVDDVILILNNISNNNVISQKMQYKDNRYELSLTMQELWTYKISVKITNNGQTKEYNDIWQIVVKEKPKIYNVEVSKDAANKIVNLVWNYKWDVRAFKVMYGDSPENLNFEKIVSQPKITIDNLDVTKTYYFKVYPLNEYWQIIGYPSEEIIISFGKLSPESCNVQNLSLRVENINWKNYLVWDKASNITKYIIYKAEDINWTPWTFVKVAETIDNKWEYPFDNMAKKDIYAYFKVVWICKDNKEYQIWQIQKVKVWPVSTILMIILLFIFSYSVYYVYSKVK